jgi:hypothetical protein
MFFVRAISRPVLGQAMPVELALVNACLMPEKQPYDRLFAQALRHGLGSLAPDRRTGGLAGTTGHVAESLVELLLDELGYHPLSHFVGPGRHGIDLLMFHPETEQLLAVEVKGTLSARRWPRLGGGQLMQMSPEWIERAIGLAIDPSVAARDLVGAFVAVNFARLAYRVAVSKDFVRWRSALGLQSLLDLTAARA